MSANQIVVLLLELTANERMHAVVATRMRNLSEQSAWYAVMTALTYRADAIRAQLVQADPVIFEAAAALMDQPPAPPEPPAWTIDPTVGTRVH